MTFWSDGWSDEPLTQRPLGLDQLFPVISGEAWGSTDAGSPYPTGWGRVPEEGARLFEKRRGPGRGDPITGGFQRDRAMGTPDRKIG